MIKQPTFIGGACASLLRGGAGLFRFIIIHKYSGEPAPTFSSTY